MLVLRLRRGYGASTCSHNEVSRHISAQVSLWRQQSGSSIEMVTAAIPAEVKWLQYANPGNRIRRDNETCQLFH